MGGQYAPEQAIAVSGGVDSMALAKLCSMLCKDSTARETYNDIQFHAFIVDHRARAESTQEANSVKDNLTRMGLTAQVLNLTWPHGLSPLDLPDFETEARRSRYQALGSACQEAGIYNLLLAHHSDDQAETVLMRLASGQKGVGLRGMHGCVEIPECQGIHGVSKSGFYENTLTYLGRKWGWGLCGPFGLFGKRNAKTVASSPVFEGGGVRIMRPLLAFSKKDLIKTCKGLHVPWFEDSTNRDWSRTPRNTFRGLQTESRLPIALNKRSLLRLSRKMNAREIQHKKAASLLRGQCRIMLIDIRSGSMIVRLPKFISEVINSMSPGSIFGTSTFLTASILIHNLAKPISPLEGIPLQSFQSAVTLIFEELAKVDRADDEMRAEPTKFTAAGVQFERIGLPLEGDPIDTGDDTKVPPQKRTSKHIDPDYVWSLTRQPFKSNSISEKPMANHKLPRAILKFGSICSSGDETPELLSWSAWRLWDGRYWIRLLNRSHQSLEIRPFREADLQALRRELPPQRLKLLENVLAAAAPGKVRWTLPAIVQADESSSRPVLALPSLGMAGDFDIAGEEVERKVDWEIRYKEIIATNPGCDDEIDMDVVTSWKDS